jgi:phosphoheptose isomerase
MPAESPFLAYARAYQERFARAVQEWDLAALERLTAVLESARASGATVHIAGNGGSAAIANHAECDCSKGTYVDGQPPLMTRSLSANTSVMTALGNDIGYEWIFERQVRYYARPGDVVVLVSSSGNSPNVVQACKTARELGLTTVALVGFRGGALAGLADHVVHIPVDHYGIVEDMHQACIHLVTTYLRATWEPSSRAG